MNFLINHYCDNYLRCLNQLKKLEEQGSPQAVIKLQKLIIERYLEKMIMAFIVENTFRTDLIDDSCN
jgi:hypothetical protein